MDDYRPGTCDYCGADTWCGLRLNGQRQCPACQVTRFYEQVLYPPLGYRLQAWQRKVLRDLYGTLKAMPRATKDTAALREVDFFSRFSIRICCDNCGVKARLPGSQTTVQPVPELHLSEVSRQLKSLKNAKKSISKKLPIKDSTFETHLDGNIFKSSRKFLIQLLSVSAPRPSFEAPSGAYGFRSCQSTEGWPSTTTILL